MNPTQHKGLAGQGAECIHISCATSLGHVGDDAQVLVQISHMPIDVLG